MASPVLLRLRRTLVAVLLGAVVLPIVVAPGVDAARSRAAIVVIHGDDSVSEECVTFAGLSARAIDVLTNSSFSLFTTRHPDFGRSICYLDGEGSLTEGCFGPGGYWQLFIQRPGKPIQDGQGASVDRLENKSVYYLKFDDAFPANPPAPRSFKSICPPAG